MPLTDGAGYKLVGVINVCKCCNCIEVVCNESRVLRGGDSSPLSPPLPYFALLETREEASIHDALKGACCRCLVQSKTSACIIIFQR